MNTLTIEDAEYLEQHAADCQRHVRESLLAIAARIRAEVSGAMQVSDTLTSNELVKSLRSRHDLGLRWGRGHTESLFNEIERLQRELEAADDHLEDLCMSTRPTPEPTPQPSNELLKRCREWFNAYMHSRENHDEAAQILATIDNEVIETKSGRFGDEASPAEPAPTPRGSLPNSLGNSLREWADSNMRNAKYGPGLLRMAADRLDALESKCSAHEPENELSDFRKGARAMFDSITYRAANNYHGKPEVNAVCEEENKIATAWATDALSEVSPEDWSEWYTVAELRKENIELKAKLHSSAPPPCVHPFAKLGIDAEGVMWCVECLTKPLVIPPPFGEPAQPPGATPVVWRHREPGYEVWNYCGADHAEHVKSLGWEIEPLYTQPAPPPSVWQPIETATKGRRVIVAYKNRLGHWRYVMARYYQPGTLTCDGDDADDDGYAPEGWYEESETHEHILRTDEEPTHWMPLPTAPTKRGEV